MLRVVTLEAESLFKQALANSEQALGPNHPDVAGALNNLAECYRAQGRYTDAEPLYERALVIIETALGADHSIFATALNNLALLYDYQRSLRRRRAALQAGAGNSRESVW